MLLKILFSVALAGCLIWLCLDRSIQPIIATCIASMAFIYAMFGKKSESVPPSNSITSGDNSVNTQSTGTINQTFNNESTTK